MKNSVHRPLLTASSVGIPDLAFILNRTSELFSSLGIYHGIERDGRVDTRRPVRTSGWLGGAPISPHFGSDPADL